MKDDIVGNTPESDRHSSSPAAVMMDQVVQPQTAQPAIEAFLTRRNRPQPLLSVVIPCYNVAPYLRQCLDSVLDQTWPNLEIIVNDDASTDDSPAIIREYEARYSGRVRGIYRAQNRGLSFTRNDGVAHAQGEYLTFLDSDDFYYDRRKLEHELALALYYREELGQEVVAWSQTAVVDEEGHYLAPLQPRDQLKQGYIFEEALMLTCVPRDFVIRRANFVSCGKYRQVVNEDWDMAIRLAARYEVYLTGLNGTAYRLRRGSLSAARYFNSPHQLWPVFCHHLERLVPDARRQEELAYRFGLALQAIREGQEAEIKTLHLVCAERLRLIEDLHQTAQERLALIEQQQIEIQRLTAIQPAARLRRWLKRLRGNQDRTGLSK